MGGEHRFTGLLGLEDQRVLPVAAQQQHDPAARADAADAHHFACHVNDGVLLQQVSAVGLETVPVQRDQLPDLAVERVAALVRQHVGHRCDQLRHGGEAAPAVDHLGELLERLQAVAPARLAQRLGHALAAPGVEHPLRQCPEVRLVHACVPHVEVVHPGEEMHLLAVGAHRRPDDVRAHALVEAVLPTGDDQARREPLDVPFPWPGQGFVEVVDVEQEIAFRGAEQPEVHHVRVAAQLGPDARVGCAGQVGGHDRGGTPVETERRLRHPAVADRHQLLHPGGRLPLDEVHRIRPVRRRLEVSVGGPRCPRPGGPAVRGPVLGREPGPAVRRGRRLGRVARRHRR